MRICCSSHEISVGRFRRSHPNKGIGPGQRANFKAAKEKSCSCHIKPKYFSLPFSLCHAECAPGSPDRQWSEIVGGQWTSDRRPSTTGCQGRTCRRTFPTITLKEDVDTKGFAKDLTRQL